MLSTSSNNMEDKSGGVVSKNTNFSKLLTLNLVKQ